jgi:hypothetical protein
MRRTIIATMTASLACALLAGPADAAFFQGEPVDGAGGDGSDIVGVGDVDIARDGTGAVAYVKRDGGVDHIFVSRILNGVWQTPERVDGAFAEAGSQPVVAAADGGRLAVAFVSGTTLYVMLKPDANTPYGAPQGLAAAGGNVFNPSIDMSIHGTAYLSFTLPGSSAADVRIARLDRKATTWDVLGTPLDIDPARDAGNGNGRSKTVVSADGTALVVWGEAGHVYARRVFDERLSAAPQDLNTGVIDGHQGDVADLPDVDIEDDSSFAWAVFRQHFDDGRYHTVAKRLVGSQFEQDTVVDGFGWGGDESARPFVDLNGRGEGMALTGSGALGAYSSLLHDDHFFNAQLLNPANNVPPQPVGGMAENNDAYVAWLQGTGPGDATVHIVSYDIDPAKRTVPAPGPDTQISTLDAGPVDIDAGFDMGVNRAGDATALFIQGTGDARRLMSAGFDRVPGTFRGYTSAKFRRTARPPLSWATSFELWGPVTYRVMIDGQPFGETQATKLTTVNPVPDGEHKWQVVATDRRGQTAATPTRTLRIDATPPKVKLTVHRRKGRVARATVKASDLVSPAVKASGVRVVRIDFGDGFRVNARKASHRYRRGGRRTIRAVVADKAGNVTVVRKRIRV